MGSSDSNFEIETIPPEENDDGDYQIVKIFNQKIQIKNCQIKNLKQPIDIIILGSPQVGKSTLRNEFYNEKWKKGKVGSNIVSETMNCDLLKWKSKRFVTQIIDGLEIRIFDSEGFSGQSFDKNEIKRVEKYIRGIKRKYKFKYQVLWYCVSPEHAIIKHVEIFKHFRSTFNFFFSQIIITKCDLYPKYRIELYESTIKNMLQGILVPIFHFSCCLNNKKRSGEIVDFYRRCPNGCLKNNPEKISDGKCKCNECDLIFNGCSDSCKDPEISHREKTGFYCIKCKKKWRVESYKSQDKEIFTSFLNLYNEV